MREIDQTTAAELAGISLSGLKSAAKGVGGPRKTSRGHFDASDFGRWLKERHRSEFGVTDDGDVLDLTAERARLARAQADKTELEVAELRGELIRAQDVIEAWTCVFAAVRARLLALPAKAAGRVAAPGLVAETQELLRGIVDEALNELAGDGLPERARARLARTQGISTATPTDGKRVGGSGTDAVGRGKRRARKVVDGKG